MKLASSIIICSRLSSRRVPNKALKEINGKPCLYHLLDRLLMGTIPVIVAVPLEERDLWNDTFSKYKDRVKFYFGSESDPLKRMYDAAEWYEVKHVIRITHDKIFINMDDVYKMLGVYMKKALEYAYSSTLTSGCGFEIIAATALKKAKEKYKGVEHISYAIKAVTKNIYDVDFSDNYRTHRLLIDYPEDFTMMETLLACLGNRCSQKMVFEFLDEQDWLTRINRLPELTVYTCGFNAEKYIETAMGSVFMQSIFPRCEFILVDDHSIDRTPFYMSRFASQHENVKYIRNGKNLGLASSSNVALKHARGKYIVRLDADDFFVGAYALRDLLTEIKTREVDAIYPNNYFGDYGVIQPGKEQHHIGGAIFKTRAVNHVKFTEGLRGYEGYDFFGRARALLDVGYLNRPVFFYRQHGASMSKNDLSERKRIKDKIEKDVYEKTVPKH